MAMMTRQRPMLAVQDLRRTIDFYRDKLGFTLGDTFGDPPVWCSLHREGVELMFNQPPDAAKDVPRRSRDYQVFYINADDVVALRDELLGHGAPCSDLRVTIYGMKEFEVRDPDHIWLWFGQPTDEPPTVTE
ncbi:MAG: VOC family protein [Phycisphaeraceae bacterium]|nr:MAG: VOC family protein [Phycisphaeraceae bacterium]